MIMENEKNNLPRKKFIFSIAGITALLAIPAFLKTTKKEKHKTVKMLTEDGRLVEVQIGNVPHQKTMIQSKEIHTWVKNKTPKS